MKSPTLEGRYVTEWVFSPASGSANSASSQSGRIDRFSKSMTGCSVMKTRMDIGSPRLTAGRKPRPGGGACFPAPNRFRANM